MRRGGWYNKFEPTTQHGPLWHERLRLVVAREPDLDSYAIAERFGLTPDAAWMVKKRLLAGLAP